MPNVNFEPNPPIEQQDNPDLIVLLFMGKIDPTNPDHLRGALDAKGRVI